MLEEEAEKMMEEKRKARRLSAATAVAVEWKRWQVRSIYYKIEIWARRRSSRRSSCSSPEWLAGDRGPYERS